jgi:CRP/FNR family transcriptional regulator, anaerobic regulatory protein
VSRSESRGRDQATPSWRDHLLRHYPVLDTLSPALTAQLHTRARVVAAPAGVVAFAEDSPCAGLTLVTGGSIRIVRSSAQGREILLYRVRAGESCILSVCCLLGRTSYAARGVVETDLTGVNIPAGFFDTLVAESPAFRSFVFDLFGSRIAALLQLVEEVAFHRLDTRLAALLLRDFAGAGATELELTHQDLADQVGSVREIVSRNLEALQERGAIALGRGRLTLVNPAALAASAGDLAGLE